VEQRRNEDPLSKATVRVAAIPRSCTGSLADSAYQEQDSVLILIARQNSNDINDKYKSLLLSRNSRFSSASLWGGTRDDGRNRVAGLDRE
jgi:hypothetical protein